jgi:glycosyltransferase involved in cell wall biosynthesis
MMRTRPHELTLVMPVYNEEACIGRVVESWHGTLSRLGIDFVMIVLNDGSRDGTGAALERFCRDDRIQVVNKRNSGHGPTILMGYTRGVEQSDWVFQVDSDDEMSPAYFAGLWQRRHDFDALFGTRTNRQQAAGRRLISAVSRLAVQILFGSGVEDVNTPYRLIRSAMLRDILKCIPPDTFAPNIIVSGLLIQGGAHILNLPVPHEGRKTGMVSIVAWRLWKAAARSLYQTISISRLGSIREHPNFFGRKDG